MADNTDISLDTLVNARLPPAGGRLVSQLRDNRSRVQGAFNRRRRGQGMDFIELRPYAPGDDPRRIDWRASARWQELQSRVYRETREHRTLILVDLRSTMFVAAQRLPAREAARLAALLLWFAQERRCRVTFCLVLDKEIRAAAFTDRVPALLSQCQQLHRAFGDARNRKSPPTSSGETPLVERLAPLLDKSRRCDTVLWLSHLEDTDSELAALLAHQVSGGALAAVRVQGGLETTGLDPGQYRYYRQGGAGRRIIGQAHIDKRLSRLLPEHLQRARDHETARLRSLGFTLIEGETDEAQLAAWLLALEILP